MVRKIVRYIFTYLGALFLMSYIIFPNNVSALTIVENVNVVKSLTNTGIYYKLDNSNTYYQNTAFKHFSNNASPENFQKITFTNSGHSWSVSRGNYISINGTFIASSIYVADINASGLFYVTSQSVDCPVIDFSTYPLEGTNQNGTQTYTYRVGFNVTCRIISENISTGPTVNIGTSLFTNPGVSEVGILFSTVVEWTPDTSNNALNNNLNNIYTWLQNHPGDNAGSTLQQEKQDVQDAADDSETAGDDSSSDAEAGTSSLISAIGTAVAAITSASPTNCRINGNMGNLNIGQIDLCANPVPSFVSVIGSLILILMVVPLCISLFNRFIGLFRSFQG